MPTTATRAGDNSRRTTILPTVNWCSRSANTSLMALFRSSSDRSPPGVPGRESASRPLTIFAARNVWLSIFSSSFVFGSPGSAPSSSIWVKLEMPVRGVLTSCATPAASNPIDAILSEICSCSSSRTRSVTFSMIRIVPSMLAGSVWDLSGTAVALTRSFGGSAPPTCPAPKRQPVSGALNNVAPCGRSSSAARNASTNGTSNTSDNFSPIASSRPTP